MDTTSTLTYRLSMCPLRRCAIFFFLIFLLMLTPTTGKSNLQIQPTRMQRIRSLNNTTKDLRIINGYSAPEVRYPYAASLQLFDRHYCGGALVAPDMVVTAAHCAENSPIITLGRYDLDDPLDFDYEEMSVDITIIHPQFDKVVVDNDVAVLILERQSVHPIVQINNDPNIPIDGEELTVMGWGDIDDHPTIKETSDELRETQVWYMPNDRCEQSKGIIKTSSGYQEATYNGELTDNMLCARDNIGTVSDACQGDSGGALVRTGTHPTGEDDSLVGLVSWGYGCSDPNFPGVYSRMSTIFPWLRETICEESEAPPPYLECDIVSVPIAVAPVPAPPPSQSLGMLTFYIKTDTTPEDTGWELRTVPDNKIIASRPMGYYTQQNTEIFEKEVVEPEKFYRLVIYDRDRDGFQGRMAVYRGKTISRSNLLVYEPGFSSKSQESVSHGFYIGDSPPNVLTLDIKFDGKPREFAWVITNMEDSLQLGFRWFGFYTNAFESVRETIPIYGADRGLQEYELLIYDNNGDGLCCASGMGSYALYLGSTVNAKYQIISGSKFSRDESFVFEINDGALMSTANKPPSLGTLAFKPAPSPTMALNDVPAPGNDAFVPLDTSYIPTITGTSSSSATEGTFISCLLLTTLSMMFAFR